MLPGISALPSVHSVDGQDIVDNGKALNGHVHEPIRPQLPTIVLFCAFVVNFRLTIPQGGAVSSGQKNCCLQIVDME